MSLGRSSFVLHPALQKWDSNPRYTPYEGGLEPPPDHSAIKLLLSKQIFDGFCIIRSGRLCRLCRNSQTFHRVATVDSHYFASPLQRCLSDQSLQPRSCYVCVGMARLELAYPCSQSKRVSHYPTSRFITLYNLPQYASSASRRIHRTYPTQHRSGYFRSHLEALYPTSHT